MGSTPSGPTRLTTYHGGVRLVGMNPFREGTTVQLKSGGPVMTVDGVHRDGEVSVCWYEEVKGTVMRVRCRAEAFRVVRPAEKE